ncbi:MAG TPA: diguanylate cyclase [Croceibacterium sp.]|nr:diguanylate cyclase [Croceibacterium sp.]
MLIAAPAIAALMCFLRSRSSPESALWTALAAALLLWSLGMGATMGAELLTGFDSEGALGLLLFVLYGVPLIFICASPVRDQWRAWMVDAALALTLGALFFAHTFTFATLAGASEEGFLKLRLMFDIENAFIAVFATLRWRAAREAAEQTFFRFLAIYSILYMVVAVGINHFASDEGYGTWNDAIIGVPFILLAALALLAPGGIVPAREKPASDGFVSFVAAGSPMMLPTALLAVSASLVFYRPILGIIGFAAALFGYGLRSILMQVSGYDERAALAALARTDGLTGLANRRTFDEALDSEWNRARRYGGELALLMIDIDYFKRLNDTLGHPAGDRCLRDVGRILSGCVQRKTDVVARYGGEEFAVILPNTTQDDAIRVAQWMRQKIAQQSLPASAQGGTVTVSIGVGCIEGPDGDDPTVLTAAADSALYQAKRGGRNRVVAATPGDTAIDQVSSSA